MNEKQIEVVASSGFKYLIDLSKLNDMRFLDVLAEAQASQVEFPKVVRFMLGEEQRNELYKYLEESQGSVPVEVVIKDFYELMEKVKELKNS